MSAADVSCSMESVIFIGFVMYRAWTAVPLYITLHAPHTHRTIEDTFTDTHSTARDRSMATLACMPTDSILCYPCLFKFIIISHTVVSAQSASCLCHQSLS
jgi:hypothetical protein